MLRTVTPSTEALKLTSLSTPAPGPQPSHQSPDSPARGSAQGCRRRHAPLPGWDSGTPPNSQQLQPEQPQAPKQSPFKRGGSLHLSRPSGTQHDPSPDLPSVPTPGASRLAPRVTGGMGSQTPCAGSHGIQPGTFPDAAFLTRRRSSRAQAERRRQRWAGTPWVPCPRWDGRTQWPWGPRGCGGPGRGRVPQACPEQQGLCRLAGPRHPAPRQGLGPWRGRGLRLADLRGRGRALRPSLPAGQRGTRG